MRSIFNPEGCLRFPQILMRLDPAAEQDPAVFEHLKGCPKCRGLFNGVVNADVETVETALDDFRDIEPDQTSAELERMIYGFLFDYRYDAGKLDGIRVSAKNASAETCQYLEKYVGFISETNATARERAADLGFIAAAVHDPIKRVGLEDVLQYLAGRGFTVDLNMPKRFQLLMAAGDGDNDTAEYKKILPNKWVCTFTYRGGGQTTVIKLDFSMAKSPVVKTPVLELMRLKGLNDGEVEEYYHEWEEIRHLRVENRQPVYEIDGRYNALLSIPDASAAYKVFTIDGFKKGKK